MEFLNISKTFRTARRLQGIVNVFLRHGFGSLIDQIHLGRHIPFYTRLRSMGQWPPIRESSIPKRLREAFAELGPSFIKMAQILSSRPDLITLRYAEELKKLQDEVPPFPTEEAKALIASELGKPLDEIFLSFTDEPIAAASIAQVHRARLRTGEDVVVKVQRPDIERMIETDIEIMYTIERLLEDYLPEMRNFNLRGIIDEFARTVRREMIFTEESRNCQRFGRMFEGSPDVHVPKVFTEYVTEKVLVLERIEGVRIDDIDGIRAMGHDLKEVTKKTVDAYFRMVLVEGFFHADPHPGNIFVTESGRIGLLDFGIIGRVTEELKENLARTMISFFKKDYDGLIDEYMELGMLSAEMDAEGLRSELKADLLEILEPVYGISLKEFNLSRHMDAVIRVFLKHNMRVPSDLLLVDKALLILESIVAHLDPEFDFVAAAEPYVASLIRSRTSPQRIASKIARNIQDTGDLLLVLPRNIKKLLSKLVRDEFHMKLTHTGFEQFIKDMDKAGNRIAFAMVVSSIIVSSAIMHAQGVGPKIFGMSVLGHLTFAFAAVLGVWLVVSIFRSGRM